MSGRVTGKHLKIFSKSDIHYCACAHRYWIIIPARTQFEKNVGNPAKFAKIVVLQQISVGACIVVDIGLRKYFK